MREIRPSGSEGGGELTLSPYPYHYPRRLLSDASDLKHLWRLASRAAD